MQDKWWYSTQHTQREDRVFLLDKIKINCLFSRPETTEWSCTECTFTNNGNALCCEMCQSPKTRLLPVAPDSLRLDDDDSRMYLSLHPFRSSWFLCSTSNQVFIYYVIPLLLEPSMEAEADPEAAREVSMHCAMQCIVWLGN